MKAALAVAAVFSAVVIVCQTQRPSRSSASLAYNAVDLHRLRSDKEALERKKPLVAPVEQLKNRIISGEEAGPCQFPHQVALYLNLYDGTSFCGGSIINEKWVLTAAHCVEGVYRGITVYAGTNDRTSGVRREGKRIFFHGEFDESLRNDVALIELDSPLVFGACMKPMELETAGCDDNTLLNETAIVSGWGATDTNSALPQRLRFTRARVITNDECIESYTTDHVDRGTLCSMPSNEEHLGTLCGGDSGGALVLESTGRQVGINSFTALNNCTSKTPHGYARVPCFINWINYVMTL